MRYWFACFQIMQGGRGVMGEGHYPTEGDLFSALAIKNQIGRTMFLKFGAVRNQSILLTFIMEITKEEYEAVVKPNDSVSDNDKHADNPTS